MKKPAKIKLTPKQAKFAQLYVKLSNATEAYKKVYRWQRMKPASVNRKAIEVLQNVNVTARIEQIRTELEKKQIISKEKIIEDLELIASVSIKDYIQSVNFKTEKVTWKPLSKWTEAMRRACSGIKPGRNGIELTVSGQEYAYNRIAKMMGYDAPLKIIQADTTLADLLKRD